MSATDEDDAYTSGVQLSITQQILGVPSFGHPIKASKLKDYIHTLIDAKDSNYPDVNGFDVEFNYIETQTSQEQYFGDYKSALTDYNKNKNRYSNVLPPEKTRVKLRIVDGEEGSDFINANYIEGLIPNSQRAYVATQGPLQATFGDFWRMVWETESAVIIMLTNEVENRKLKCDRYWPDVDCPLSCYPFKVVLDSQNDTDELTTRKLTLHNLIDEETRDIHHFQYTAWPDHGLPVSTHAFLELAHVADTANETKGPIVVHCSAGIGRTGTFCTVHSTVEKLRLDLQQNPEIEPEFNIIKTVLFMREQRPGMVQTKEQYMFCYLTLLEECERLFISKKQAQKIVESTIQETNESSKSSQNSTEEKLNHDHKEASKDEDSNSNFTNSSTSPPKTSVVKDLIEFD